MNEPVTLLAALKGCTALVLAVLAGALLWRPRRYEPGRVWLGVVLAVNTVLLVESVALTVGWLSPVATPVLFSLFFASFALSPLGVFVVVRHLAQPRPLSIREGSAFVPAGLLAVGLLVTVGLWEEPRGPYAARDVWVVALLALHAIAVASFGFAVPYLRGLPPWGRAVFALFVGHWLLSGASSVAALAGFGGSLLFETASVVVLLVFGLVAAGASLRHLAEQVPRVPHPRPVDPGDAALGDQLRRLLTEERLFLDPNLTLDVLTARVGASERDVSRVLNTVLGGGYHEVVRRYRVREAQRLLRDQPGATVLEVLYEAGFNSKSAFHRAFREQVGMTPSAYRRRQAGARVS